MNVREKLVALLAGCPCESDCEGKLGSCPSRKNGNCNEIFKLSYCATSKLVSRLIANGVTVQEWISTEDRLPELFGTYCVVVMEDGGYRYSDFADYDPFAKRWRPNLRYTGANDKVTHWMPLPEPPKED